MGNWKKRKLSKGQRASRTRSTPCRIYIATPPLNGWPGGDPINNGWKPKAGK